METNSYRPIGLRMEDGLVLSCEDIADANWQASLMLKSGIVICSAEKITPRIENGRCFFLLTDLSLLERNSAFLKPDADCIASLYAQNGSWVKSGNEKLPFKLSLEQYKLLLGSRTEAKPVKAKVEKLPIPKPPRAASLIASVPPQEVSPVEAETYGPWEQLGPWPQVDAYAPKPERIAEPTVHEMPDAREWILLWSPSRFFEHRYERLWKILPELKEQMMCRPKQLGLALFKRPETRFIIATPPSPPPFKAESPRIAIRKMRAEAIPPSRAVAIAPQPIKVRFIIPTCTELLFKKAARKQLCQGDSWGTRFLIPWIPRPVAKREPELLTARKFHVIVTDPVFLFTEKARKLLTVGAPVLVLAKEIIEPQQTEQSNETKGAEEKNAPEERKPVMKDIKLIGAEPFTEGLGLRLRTSEEAPPGTVFEGWTQLIDSEDKEHPALSLSEFEKLEYDLNEAGLKEGTTYRSLFAIKGVEGEDMPVEFHLKEGKVVLGPVERPPQEQTEPAIIASQPSLATGTTATTTGPAAESKDQPAAKAKPKKVDVIGLAPLLNRFGFEWGSEPKGHKLFRIRFHSIAENGERKLISSDPFEGTAVELPPDKFPGKVGLEINVGAISEIKSEGSIMLGDEGTFVFHRIGAAIVEGLPKPTAQAPEPVQPTPPPTRQEERPPVSPPAAPDQSQHIVGAIKEGFAGINAEMKNSNVALLDTIQRNNTGLLTAVQGIGAQVANSNAANVQALNDFGRNTTAALGQTAQTLREVAELARKKPEEGSERKSEDATSSPSSAHATMVGLIVSVVSVILISFIVWIFLYAFGHWFKGTAKDESGTTTLKQAMDYTDHRVSHVENLEGRVERLPKMASLVSALTNSGAHMENNSGGIMTGSINITNNTGTININIGSKNVAGATPVAIPYQSYQPVEQPSTVAQAPAVGSDQTVATVAPPLVPPAGFVGFVGNRNSCYGYAPVCPPGCASGAVVSFPLPFPIISINSGNHDHHDNGHHGGGGGHPH